MLPENYSFGQDYSYSIEPFYIGFDTFYIAFDTFYIGFDTSYIAAEPFYIAESANSQKKSSVKPAG